MSQLVVDILGKDELSAVVDQLIKKVQGLNRNLRKTGGVAPAVDATALSIGNLADSLERASGFSGVLAKDMQTLGRATRRYSKDADKAAGSTNKLTKASVLNVRANRQRVKTDATLAKGLGLQLQAQNRLQGSLKKTSRQATQTSTSVRELGETLEQTGSKTTFGQGILAVIHQVEADAKKSFGTTNSELDKLAKSLDDATDPANRLRNAIDGVSDRLALYGKAGNDARAVLEDIQNPQTRLRASAKLAARAMRGQGLATSFLSDRLKILKAEAILAAGGIDVLRRDARLLKGGLLGVTGVLTGGLALGYKTFINNNKATQRAARRTKRAFEELSGAFVSAALGGRNVGGTFKAITRQLKSVTDSVNDNRKRIAQTSKDVLSVGVTLAKGVFNIGGGIVLFVQGTIDGVKVLVRESSKLIIDLLDGLANTAFELPGVKRTLGLTDRDLIDFQKTLRFTRAEIEKEGFGFAKTSRLSDDLEAINGQFDGLLSRIENTKIPDPGKFKIKADEKATKEFNDRVAKILGDAEKQAQLQVRFRIDPNQTSKQLQAQASNFEQAARTTGVQLQEVLVRSLSAKGAVQRALRKKAAELDAEVNRNFRAADQAREVAAVVKAREDAEKLTKERIAGLDGEISKIEQRNRLQLQFRELIRIGDTSELQGRLQTEQQELVVQQQIVSTLEKRRQLETDPAVQQAITIRLEKAQSTAANLQGQIATLQGSLSDLNTPAAFGQALSSSFNLAAKSAAEVGKTLGDGLRDGVEQSVGLVANNLATALGNIGRKGADSATEAAKKTVAGIAGIWGDLFIAQGTGLIFTNPGLGFGLIGAGIGIKALSTRLGGGGGGGTSSSPSSSSSIAQAASRVNPNTSTRPTTENEPTPIELVLDDQTRLRSYLEMRNEDDLRRG